mmetsp:Transcript_115397/g.321500  ORF Transcript_115397/g.321500 Transcript_115397/m.321500 type:complete len:240 (-) Transcript_115397:694-1413(-)
MRPCGGEPEGAGRSDATHTDHHGRRCHRCLHSGDRGRRGAALARAGAEPVGSFGDAGAALAEELRAPRGGQRQCGRHPHRGQYALGVCGGGEEAGPSIAVLGGRRAASPLACTECGGGSCCGGEEAFGPRLERGAVARQGVAAHSILQCVWWRRFARAWCTARWDSSGSARATRTATTATTAGARTTGAPDQHSGDAACCWRPRALGVEHWRLGELPAHQEGQQGQQSQQQVQRSCRRH